MKKYVLSLAVVSALLLVTTNVQAQSWKDLFNKDNIEKVVNAVTGNQTIDMTGTWTYSGSAIEFESDNLLQKAGGAAAAAVAEKKLDEQLAKVGIKDGQVSFTFNADSTFTSTVGKRTMTGTYSYDATDKVVHLRYFKLLNMNAKVNCTSTNMDLLFNSASELIVLRVVLLLLLDINAISFSSLSELNSRSILVLVHLRYFKLLTKCNRHFFISQNSWKVVFPAQGSASGNNW